MMNKRNLLISVLLLLSTSIFATKTRKAVFVILDGIPADMIERLAPPTIHTIAAEGGYAEAYCGGTIGRYDQTPTISAVGYASILTSGWANKHNVWNNSPQPNYNYWSIFRIAQEQKKKVTTALYSSWTDNRTVLLGENKPQTNKQKIDFIVDGLDLDTVKYPKEKEDLHIFKIDEAISEAAATGIRKDAADLNWVYLWYTDDASHIHGNGDVFDRYTMLADKQVERIWEAVKYREANYNEEWLVIITTDHGRTDNGYGHGGQSKRERTCWISTNVQPNTHFGSDQLSLADINPTICRYMGFKIPSNVAWEQDGIPFIGKTDVSYLEAIPHEKGYTLKWNALNDKSEVTIYYSNSNQYRSGGSDKWVKAGKIKAGKKEFTLNLPPAPNGFYKFAAVTPNNHLTIWSGKSPN